MSEGKRFTRSSTSSSRKNPTRAIQAKEQAEIELKVKEAIAANNFN